MVATIITPIQTRKEMNKMGKTHSHRWSLEIIELCQTGIVITFMLEMEGISLQHPRAAKWKETLSIFIASVLRVSSLPIMFHG